eukprot:g24480.t1
MTYMFFDPPTFVGHRCSSTSQDDRGGAHAFSLEDLRALLTATNGAARLQLVFLNACCSDLAGLVFLDAGAPHVVCCRGSVFDATASSFTKAFYRAFAAGKTGGPTFDLAKLEIRTAPQPGLRAEADKYLLLPEDDPTHHSCFCELSWSRGAAERLLRFLRQLARRLRHIEDPRVHVWEEPQAEALNMDLSAPSEARILRSQIVQRLRELEGHHPVLMILDDLDPGEFASTVDGENISNTANSAIHVGSCVLHRSMRESSERQRKILTELLLRTERLELLLSARQAPFQALGAHKVVGYQLEPLQPLDAARLFLWRVHRPLVFADFSVLPGDDAQGPSKMLPLIMNAQNRGVLLQELSGHPLLQWCGGCPGHLRAAADHVLPGSGTLWDARIGRRMEDMEHHQGEESAPGMCVGIPKQGVCIPEVELAYIRFVETYAISIPPLRLILLILGQVPRVWEHGPLGVGPVWNPRIVYAVNGYETGILPFPNPANFTRGYMLARVSHEQVRAVHHNPHLKRDAKRFIGVETAKVPKGYFSEGVLPTLLQMNTDDPLRYAHRRPVQRK